jgi:hypothetical protein
MKITVLQELKNIISRNFALPYKDKSEQGTLSAGVRKYIYLGIKLEKIFPTTSFTPNENIPISCRNLDKGHIT